MNTFIKTNTRLNNKKNSKIRKFDMLIKSLKKLDQFLFKIHKDK